MIEIPEAALLARQVTQTLGGKVVQSAAAGQSPHKFAWFSGSSDDYARALAGRAIEDAVPRGGMLEVHAGDAWLLFQDGVNLRYHADPADRPDRHQLLLEFSDGSALSASVAMYGGLYCFPAGQFDNPYYQAAREKPSPLGADFTLDYFLGLFQPALDRLSAKAFLATGQRIPGLGNGVLQDILYHARVNPKRKMGTLDAAARERLYEAVVTTLHEMTAAGGRDTERDLFGRPGGYATKMSKNTVGQPCPECGSLIVKEAYMGGSVYYCPGCQA